MKSKVSFKTLLLITMLLFLPLAANDQENQLTGEIDEDDISYILLKEPKLKPLTKSEKIRWSFRIADTDLFL